MPSFPDAAAEIIRIHPRRVIGFNIDPEQPGLSIRDVGPGHGSRASGSRASGSRASGSRASGSRASRSRASRSRASRSRGDPMNGIDPTSGVKTGAPQLTPMGPGRCSGRGAWRPTAPPRPCGAW